MKRFLIIVFILFTVFGVAYANTWHPVFGILISRPSEPGPQHDDGLFLEAADLLLLETGDYFLLE